ncbi:type V CRISPR-associated protein Cas12k [Trichocoleus sp. Lan]|uniref:type V CRISPR-associated protein Cas12k n=1 Tax=Trichocoleus sp. Lan TaxID=2933927 RepID=UPI00329A0C70
MSIITVQCQLKATEASLHHLWQLMVEKNTLLVNELLKQINTHPDLDNWLQEGNITAEVINGLCKNLRAESHFQDMPGRFANAAENLVKYIYKSWFAQQEKRKVLLQKKQHWLDMLRSDLELELESGCSLKKLRTQATKVLTKKKAELERNQEEKSDQAPKDNSKALFNSLFQAYDKAKAPQQRCAIAYLLKNNCEVREVEEDPEAYQLRRRKKEIEIDRLDEQLKSRLPKGRNLSDQEWLEALEQAQELILDDEKFREVQASLTRKQSSVPFSISYETSTDLRWSRNEHKRICVSFNGKGISKHTFEVFCDQRQLHWFERLAQDYKIFTQNKEQVPAGLLTLRSARLVWQEGEGKGEPWQVHRLLLHCSVETRLWTAEGTEEVRAEKIAKTQKIIDSMKAKGSQSNKLTAHETSLKLLKTFDGFSRPSQAGYKGNPSIVIGVSFGRTKPATVAIVNIETGKVLAYRDVKQLLSKPIKEGKTKKKKTQYEQLKRRREQQRLNNYEHHNAQKKGTPCNFGESRQGEYVDRLLAKAIVEVALQYRASSIVLPDLRNIREAAESEVKARAEQRFPGYQELQDCYAQDYRASIHRWSYKRLAECIQVKAQRAGIATEKAQQPHGDTPQEKARNLVLAACENRKVSAS